MTRVKRGFKARHRRKKVLKLGKGFKGARNSRYRTAVHVVRRSLVYAYRDRRVKRRMFRRLWIIRINAAVRGHGLTYNQFMFGLKRLGLQLDRSSLADIALQDAAAFSALVDKVKPFVAERLSA